MYFLQQDYGRMLLSYLLKCQTKRQESVSELSDETINANTPDSLTPDILQSGAMTPNAFTPDAEDPNTEDNVLSGASDQQLTSKMRQLSDQVNGTQLPLTRNGLDVVQEPVDERNEKREKGKNDERDKERREVLCDMEVDVDQEDSEMNEDKYQKAGKELPDVEDNEIENIKLRNSETLTTNMIDKLHNESAVETQRIARMPQKECFDCKVQLIRELNSTNNFGSEGQIKTTEDKANYMSEGMHVYQNVEQGKKDRSDSRGGEDPEPEPVKNQHSVNNEAHIEPEAQGLLEIDKQRETPVESWEKSEKVETQECRKPKKDPEYAAESKNDSVDNTGSEKRMNKEEERLTYRRQDDLDCGEEGNSDYTNMIENVVKGLNILEEETEAHISKTRYSISDFADELSKEKEEITGKQKEPNQSTQDNEIGFYNERMNKDEQTQESDMENESRGNLVEKIEACSCVAEAEQCNDHTLKDVLDCTPPGQEEFLPPEEIYKVRFVFDLCSLDVLLYCTVASHFPSFHASGWNC